MASENTAGSIIAFALVAAGTVYAYFHFSGAARLSKIEALANQGANTPDPSMGGDSLSTQDPSFFDRTLTQQSDNQLLYENPELFDSPSVPINYSPIWIDNLSGFLNGRAGDN